MRVVRLVRRHGLAFSLNVLAQRLLPEWLFCYETLRVERVATDRRVRAERGARCNVTVHRAETKAERTRLEQFVPVAEDAQGPASEGYFACVDGQFVGGGWLARGFCEDRPVGMRIQLAANQCWLHTAKIHRDYRRLGIFSHILDFVNAGLEEHEEAISMYNQLNRGSAALAERHASGPAGAIRILRLFGWTWCRTQGDVHADRRLVWRVSRHPIEIRVPPQSRSS